MEDSFSLALFWPGKSARPALGVKRGDSPRPTSARLPSARRLSYLAFVDRFGYEPKSERTDYFSDRIEFRLRRTAQRFVETFPGKTCLFCDLCHAFGSSDRIKCIADELGIVRCQRLREVVGHRLRALEIICGVEF